MRRHALSPRVRLAAALCAACLAVGCPADAPTRTNVVLVLLDTVRADKLGCYGNERGLTPNLDAFAAGATLFENASSHAPWTLPATASIYTGLLPTRHGAGGFIPKLTALSEQPRTLAELARAAGCATHAIVNVAFLGASFGMTRGFDTVDERYFENNEQVRRADESVDLARAWIDAHASGPFFLVLHLFDAHAVYDPPQPFRRRFARPEDAESDRFAFGSRADMVALRSGQMALDPHTLARAEALYDGEIAFVDAQLGRLLAHLSDAGLEQRTLVAVTSDHGEEFLEHGGFEHGHSHYTELLHVPLIVRHPSWPAGTRVAQAVSHADLLPTISELAEWSRADGVDGVSLTPLVREPRSPGHAALAIGNFWGPPLASLRTANEKLIVFPAGSSRPPELYLWREDPLELWNVGPARPDDALDLQRRLQSALQRLEALASPARPASVDEATRKVLETIGYTDSAPVAPGQR